MYVIRLKGTEKVSVIKEQKRLSMKIDASVGTIRANHDKYSWEWGDYIVYNPISVDTSTRKKGNPYNFVKRFDQ